MKRSSFVAVLLSSLLLGVAGQVFAADPSQDSADESVSHRKPKQASQKPNPKIEARKKEAAKIKLVDINGASVEELKTLPGITEDVAKKIVAGRPYGSKAHLVSRNIIGMGTYDGLKKRVIAKQPNKDAAQNAALYAPKQTPKK